MGFKEIIEKLRGRESNDGIKDYIREMDKRSRAEDIVLGRKKSSNERELERLHNEDREKTIKAKLEFMRKKRQHDINFGHNPLNAKNVIKKQRGDWEMLKERNLFSNERNIFTKQKNIFTRK